MNEIPASRSEPWSASRLGKPVTAVIVGAGRRSLLYASYALQHPHLLRIVGVVDPDETRRLRTADIYNIPPQALFADVEGLARQPAIADAAINGTMDDRHVDTTVPLLKAGYHVLLEKPIGTSEEEVLRLYAAARETGKTVMICHVLRYAPFYSEIRQRVRDGEIGTIVNIQTYEHVSYHHMAVAFIRGKWNNKAKCKSSMLMAKCCHDLDIIAWMKAGISPEKVGSFGGLMQFRPERAPAGAGRRCLTDCEIETDCVYSARKHYLEQNLWRSYVWYNFHLGIEPGMEEKIESLRTDNPYGRCVWHCDNDAVDHQSVIVQFSDGCTATHNLVGGSSKPCRSLHLMGTKGEIAGVMEDGYYVVRRPDARAGREYAEERFEIEVSGDMHGGGDMRLVEDFVKVIRGDAASLAATAIEDSIYGHLIGFAADRALEEHRWLTIRSL